MIRHSKQHDMGRGVKGGYTLLFAVLTAGIVMTMAVFIVNVSTKQYQLSVSARNSSYAFYAADSLMECVVNSANWQVAFSSSTPGGGALVCGGNTLVLAQVGTPQQTASMSIMDGPPGNPVRQWAGYAALYFPNSAPVSTQCAQLIMTTGVDTATSKPKTVVDTRGYNLCAGSPVLPDASNINVVERALRLVESGIW